MRIALIPGTELAEIIEQALKVLDAISVNIMLIYF